MIHPSPHVIYHIQPNTANRCVKKITLNDWNSSVQSVMSLFVERILLHWIRNTTQIISLAVTAQLSLDKMIHTMNMMIKSIVIFTIVLDLLYLVLVAIWQS